MKVTEFATRAGVGPEVVRYYVREGLLTPIRDPTNGYKRFGHPHLARIHFIRLAQTFGFTLREIHGLLARIDAGDCPCADMHRQLRSKIAENRLQIRELQERQDRLERAYANWNRAQLGSGGVGELCRLLERIDALTTLD